MQGVGFRRGARGGGEEDGRSVEKWGGGETTWPEEKGVAANRPGRRRGVRRRFDLAVAAARSRDGREASWPFFWSMELGPEYLSEATKRYFH